MLIAISQRQRYNEHGAAIDVLEQAYPLFLHSLGIQIIPIPNISFHVDYYFEHLPIRGIILTGGEDIDPKLYGENIDWPNISPLRDQTEKRILEVAIARKIPVLGVCRGMQFINVFFGGKLARDINKQKPVHPLREDHPINIVGELLKKELGAQVIVNSFHNQAIIAETLTLSLKMFALSKKDEIIEGIYHPHLPIAGIQWHPERKSPNPEINGRLIKAFVKRKLFWKI